MVTVRHRRQGLSRVTLGPNSHANTSRRIGITCVGIGRFRAVPGYELTLASSAHTGHYALRGAESVPNADLPSEGAKMTCYLLGHVEVVDPTAYRVYAAAVIEQLAAVGGRVLAAGPVRAWRDPRCRTTTSSWSLPMKQRRGVGRE